LFDLEIKDIMYIPRDKKNFTSIFHGSKNGKNSTYSNDLLHCFRCNVYHTAITSLAVMAGVATCSDAGYGHRFSSAGTSTIDMRNGATSYAIWQYARTEKHIPVDDTPPSAAIRWFAIESGICRADEIIDGWKLPNWVYREARRLLLTNV
jgi:putative DNA primase/helicase